jgi:hypothetical protein
MNAVFRLDNPDHARLRKLANLENARRKALLRAFP